MDWRGPMMAVKEELGVNKNPACLAGFFMRCGG